MKTKMKTKVFLSVLTIAITFMGCTKDSPAPVETVITETITELNSFFNAYAGTPIERQYQDLFASLRNQRAYLRYKCLE